MIKDKDQNKQRAAAELLAGVLGGMTMLPGLWPLELKSCLRFKTLADLQAGCSMEMVQPKDPYCIASEYQVRHTINLDCFPRGKLYYRQRRFD